MNQNGWQPDQFNYVIFPLHFLREIHWPTHYRQTLQKIMNFGLIKYHLTRKLEWLHILKQVIYLYGRNGLTSNLQAEIKQALEDGLLWWDEEKKGGFYGDVFDPDVYWVETLDAWLAERPNLRFEAEFSVKLAGEDINNYLKKWTEYTKELRAFEGEFGKDILSSIRVDILKDFYRYINPMIFCAYASLRSIQGREKYMRTNKQTILIRMAGAKSNEVFEHRTSQALKEDLAEVGKRYPFEKLLKQLQVRKLITGRFTLPTKTNQYLLSCSVGTKEIAELHAQYVLDQRTSKENQEAIDLFNSLIHEKL